MPTVIVLKTVDVIVSITVAAAGQEPVDEDVDAGVEVDIIEEELALPQTGTTLFKPKNR